MPSLHHRGLAPALGIALPIVQAPMAGGITTPALVAAVRALTARPFAVNLFVLDEPGTFARDGEARAIARLASWRARYGLAAQSPPARLCESFAAQLEALAECAPAVASFHFGMPPRERIDALRRAGTRVLGTATNLAEARAWTEAGADAIVAQGVEAGGHRGTFLGDVEGGSIGTLALVPRLVDATGLPVIAAGGIMDGRGIAAAFALGAGAVQMGTAFLACDESGAHPKWKAALGGEADARGTRLTRVFSGRWARGLVNGFMDAHRADEAAVPPYPLQNALTAELRAAAAMAGDVEAMSLWAGQAAALTRPMSAAELVGRLAAKYEAAVASLGSA
jgi:nitronate monooxygenase